MTTKKIFFPLLCLLLLNLFYGQKKCIIDNIVGKWSLVNVAFQEVTNIDSLKNEVSSKKYRELVTTFNADGSYNGGVSRVTKSELGIYSIDTVNCELKLNSKGKVDEQLVVRILLLNDKVLIFQQDTGNIVLTFGLRRIIPDTINCNVKNLLGKWDFITMVRQEKIQIDSLKELAKDFSKIIPVWKFTESGEYRADINSVMRNGFIYTETGSYTFDNMFCELVMRHSEYGENITEDSYEVILLDSRNLVLRVKYGYENLYFRKQN